MLDITQFFPFFSQKAQCQAGENEKFPLFLTHTSGLVDRVEFQYNRSSGWIVKYYRNGNIMLMLGLKGKYDAWNRLVETRDSSNNQVARYDYNGLNQRIKKPIGSVVTKSFFNSTVTSCIWGLRYIDDLVYRQCGTEKLYSLADPNWNVVATTNATGTVQERMRYDAFGKITWLNATFGTKASSGFAWNRAFTGQVLDTETSLILYRNRFYHTGLGRFVTRDSIGYEAGDENLYRYVGNRAGVRVDTYGLEWWNDGGSSDWINPFAYSAWAENAIGEWWKQCGECTPKSPPETILHFSDPFPAVGKPALIDWGHNMMVLGDTATMIGAGGNLAQGIQGIPSAIGEAGGTVATPISPHEP